VKPLWLVLAALALPACVIVYRRLGRVPALLGVVAATVLLLYGLGVIHLPSVEEFVTDVGTTLGAWTYLLVGSLAFLECAAFIGLFAPGELAVVLGGIVAGRGDIDLAVLIAVVWLSALAGDVAGYTFGRKVGRNWALEYGDRFGVTDARLLRAESYFARHGGKTIVIGRFVGIVRALTPFVAGTSRMPLRRFLVADAIGAGLWATTFCVLGFLFWRSLDRALELLQAGKLGILGVFTLAAVAFGAHRFVKHPEDRRRFLAWVRGLVASRSS
jgi:membrane protein DedA with SNARE-associated domain